MKTSKLMTNMQIAELLKDVAAAYQLKDENKYKFQIIAYQRAADSVEHATSELQDLWQENKLDEISGIGSSIKSHLDEIFRTGKSKHFASLIKDIPEIVFELMKVPGIGVKTAMKITNELNVKSINDVIKAIQENKIANLPGFGPDSQERIKKSIEEYQEKAPSRMLLPYAGQLSDEIIKWMKKVEGVEKIDTLGSLRRKVSTIGDIDIAVATKNKKGALDHFTKYPKAIRILEKGDRTAGILLPGNIRVDIMVCEPSSYGSLLQHFTGSKNHNIALREYAIKHGLSLSDYGIYIKEKNKKILKKIKTEEEFYQFLGMKWIPPEMRENNGEIKLAISGKIPKLVELSDIKGDFHIHSNFDIETSHDIGSSPMEDIVIKAISLGYEYIAFSEHNPSKNKHNEGQIKSLLMKKKEKIDKLNYSIMKDSEKYFSGVKKRIFKVFNSLEIDILPDGKLPVPPSGLETLDFALVSIHSSFDQPKKMMTERVLTALDNPKVKIFAHPTARKLNERDGVDLDWEKIFEKCKKNNIWLEINSDPARLDLPDTLVHEAIKQGIKLVIDTDTHVIDSLENMKWGVSVARRGWCTKDDIINTRGLKDLEVI